MLEIRVILIQDTKKEVNQVKFAVKRNFISNYNKKFK